MRGTIVQLCLDRGFGFIRPADGGADIFFHVNNLDGLEFDEQLQERRVTYDMAMGSRTGKPRADVVRPAD